ncbi:hypothetical protein jhhlp_007323 [Lomentospora prolificans]|uniref:N-acetylglucosamine-induced protein 1 n=1 Tax=Lomentospora prolificans TaxID=41688 RepID=A0A2N3N2B2_9PEZI|nr:hypothetical protein jhhlp_007323 [Lomentospora prolificans]
MGDNTKELPYWQVNIPEDQRSDECPVFLRDVKVRDLKIISTPDTDFSILTWEDVQTLVGANRIDHLCRLPSELRRYLAFIWQIKQDYGTVTNFLLEKRLGWHLPLKPRGAPFEHDDDIKVLYNDWPYGIDPRIVHLLVWTKFPLQEDAETGDLTAEGRATIEEYVNSTFRSRVPADQVLWFRNWSSLKSVRTVEHFHVMLYDPDMDFINEITNGDIPYSKRAS